MTETRVAVVVCASDDDGLGLLRGVIVAAPLSLAAWATGIWTLVRLLG